MNTIKIVYTFILLMLIVILEMLKKSTIEIILTSIFLVLIFVLYELIDLKKK